jgi:hypothetical protein
MDIKMVSLKLEKMCAPNVTVFRRRVCGFERSVTGGEERVEGGRYNILNFRMLK